MISGIAAIAAEAPNLATAPFMTAAIVGGQAARYQTLWINRLRRPGFLTGPTTERDERPAHGSASGFRRRIKVRTHCARREDHPESSREAIDEPPGGFDLGGIRRT